MTYESALVFYYFILRVNACDNIGKPSFFQPALELCMAYGG